MNNVNIDNVPLNRFHFKITALTFGAHLTDGYIIGLIGMVFTLITPLMHLNSFWQGAIGSAVLIGLFAGSLFFGFISDKLGRQKIFCISFILVLIGSLAQFYANTPLELFFCRALIGIGLGGDYTVGHALLAEFLPKKSRGAILGSFSVVWTFGYVLATFIAKFVIELDLGQDTWRYLLASTAIPAAIILIARIGTPESPRWLMQHGRKAEAEAVVKKYFGPNVTIENETDQTSHQTSTSSVKLLFSRKYIKRTLFNCIFFTCIVMPYFAIYTFLPMILDVMKLSNDFTTETILNLMLLLGAVIGIYCTYKYSRRGFLIYSFVLLSVSLLLISILPDTFNWALVLLFAFFTIVLSAVSNLVGVFPAESFPTEVRSSGIGIATAVSRLGSAASTFILPISLLQIGITGTMFLLVLILVFGLIISYFWAPETKNLSLVEASKVDKDNAHVNLNVATKSIS